MYVLYELSVMGAFAFFFFFVCGFLELVLLLLQLKSGLSI